MHGENTTLKSVLFVPNNRGAFQEMMALAKCLLDDKKVKPFFLFTNGCFTNSDVLEQLNIDYLILKEENTVKKKTISDTFLSRLMSIRGFAPLIRLIKNIKSFHEEKSQVYDLIGRENVIAVIANGDRVGLEIPAMCVGKKNKIPTIIIPYAQSFPQASVKYRQKKWKNNTNDNKLLRKLLPNQYFYYHNEYYSFYSKTDLVSLYILRLLPRNPWMIGGGNSTKVAVENMLMFNTFLKYGIPLNKLILTGKVSDDSIFDVIYKSRKTNYYKTFGLSNNQKIILCAVPQLAEHSLLSWEDHWKEIEFLISTLSKVPNSKLLLSLHPKSTHKNYDKLADKYNASIIKERYYEVMPDCDLFVATISSTLMVASMLKKYAVAVDFYGLDYDFYDQDEYVRVVRDKNKFYNILLKELDKNRSNNTFENELFDGKCTERIKNLVYTECKVL